MTKSRVTLIVLTLTALTPQRLAAQVSPAAREKAEAQKKYLSLFQESFLEPFIKSIEGDEGQQLLAPIRKLQFTVTGDTLSLNPTTGLIAKVQFAGEGRSHDLFKDGTAYPTPIPKDVHLILVSLIWSNGAAKSREINVVFIRELFLMDTNPAKVLIPAFIFSPDNLEISQALINFSKLPKADTYVLNGTSIAEYDTKSRTTANGAVRDVPALARQSLLGWSSVRSFRIQHYPFDERCRLYTGSDSDFIDVVPPGLPGLQSGKDNGIVVAPSRVFDTYTLRQMLASTASQLAGISGFNQASVVAALGTLQGVTRDASYLSGQVTTNATPAVSNSAVNATTGNDTIANSSGRNTGFTGGVTGISCPPGSQPAIISTGPACATIA